MRICKYCDREAAEGSDVCEVCAGKLEAIGAKPAQTSQRSFNSFKKEDVKKNMPAACVSYIPLGFLIPVLLKTKSEYVIYHIRGGERLSAAAAIMAALRVAAQFIVGAAVSPVYAGMLLNILSALLLLLWLAMFAHCVCHALTGRVFKTMPPNKTVQPR